MEKFTSEHLREQIAVLESRRAGEELELRKQFRQVHEALRPSRLVMSTIRDLASSQEVRTGILDAAMGMAAGVATKKLIVGSNGGIIKSVLGNIIEFFVANGVSKNSEAIKSTVVSLIQKFLNKNEKEADPSETNNPEHE